jgi:RHS repeat-associated protein
MHRSSAASALAVSLFLHAAVAGCTGDEDFSSLAGNPVTARVDPKLRGGEPTPEAREERGAVGTIDATFDVNSNGAATYAVPIKVPPGVRGIEPRLSVAYSSQLEESGVLGVGFLLSGLSRIERCARTVAVDGVAGTVDLTRRDRLCLDGVRLIKTEGAGDYMADRSRYRTENETWTRVEAVGTCDNVELPPGALFPVATGGPCTITATLKNGTVVKYGELEQAVCSRLSTSQNSARTEWPITSITDLNGNRMVIQYTATGEHQCVPTAMRYTSNTAAGTNAQREVRFVYEGRALTVTEWMGGFARRLDKRLARLETYVLGSQYSGGETMVKQYRFEYQPSPTTAREVLSRMLECDGSTCLPPTDFTATADPHVIGPPYYVDPGVQRVPRRDVDRLVAGDFNGDGKADYLTARVLVENDENDPTDVLYDLNLSTPGQFPDVGFNRVDWHGKEWFDARDALALHTTDVNADGFSDLVQLMHPCFHSDGARVHLGSPAGLATTTDALVAGLSQADNVHLGDFDGDGRGDLLTTSRRDDEMGPCAGSYDGWRLYKWNGSTFVLTGTGEFGPESDWNNFDEDKDSLHVHQGDYNGDGRVDFVVTKRVFDFQGSYTRWRLFLSDGNGFDPQPEAGIWPHYRYDVAVGDFNGDSFSDLLLTARSKKSDLLLPISEFQQGHMLVLSTGRTLKPVIVTPQSFTREVGGQVITIPWGSTGAEPGRWDAIEVANFNGDDKDDVLTTYDLAEEDPNDEGLHQKRIFVALDGLSLTFATNLNGIVDATHLIGDFDEDGVNDVLHDYGPAPAIKSYMLFGRKNDQIERVVDGIGQSIEVQYLAMLNAGVYEKGTGASYPVRDFVSGRRVVSLVHRTQAGVGETPRVSSYHYYHARTDLEGRGFLGFAKIRVADESEATSLTSTYRQDFPYAGLISQQIRAGSNEVCPQRKTLFQYEEAATGFPGVHGVRLHQRSEHEYTQCTIETHWRTLTYDYDAYGNVELLEDAVPGSLLRTAKSYDNDPVNWRLGYALTEDVSDGSTSLGKKRFDYDGKRNLTFEGSWDQQHQKWLGVTQGYNAHGNPISSTDPKSGVTHFNYDAYQLPAGAVNQLGQPRAQVMDPRFGAEVERSDPNGNKTWMTLDGYGRTTAVSLTSPQGQVVEAQRFRLTRDPQRPDAGYVSQTFSRRSWNTAEWDWKEEFRDAYGRLYRTRSRGGYDDKPIRVDYEYTAYNHDRVWRASQPYLEGDTPDFTTYVYDDKKRITRATLPDGKKLETEYLDETREVRRTDPQGEQMTQTLDGRGNVTRLVDPKGIATSMAYDALGRLRLTTRPGGEKTTVVYDGLGRTDRIESSISGITSYTYDDTGHLTEERDGKGQRIVRVHDALDRTRVKRYFDAAGQLTRVAAFEYDDPAMMNSRGQLSHVTVEDGAGGVQSRYDFAYDRYGHQTDVALEIDGYTFHWSAEHDPAGRLVRSVYPDGADVRTELTPAAHVERIILHEAGDPPGVETTYARYTGHDARGNPAQLRHSNGVTSCYAYQAKTDLLERAATFHTAKPDPVSCSQPPADAKPLLDYGYTWDDVYNLARIDDHLDPSRSQTFTYNARGELESATSPGLYGNLSYDHGLSNQLVKNGAEIFSFNQAAGKGTQVVGSSQGLSVTYDANGNMATRTRGSDALLYHWDVSDRLTKVDKNGATQATFVYDENGHRLKKTDASGTTYYVSQQYEVFVPAGGGAPRHTKYIRGPAGTLAQITRSGVTLASLVGAEARRGLTAMIDTGTLAGMMASVRRGVLLHVEPATVARWLGRAITVGALAALLGALALRRRRRDRLARRPGLALLAAATAFAVLATYGISPGVARAAMTPGPDGAGVPVDGVFHFHANHIGSSTLVTDAAGLEVTRIEYDPFGRLLPASSGTDASRPKFTGKELDATGLYYSDSRYYDPELGVFISADDRLGGDPLKSASFNRYAYALNNPVTLTDASGHFVAELIFCVAAAVAVVVGALVAGTDGKIFTDPGNAFDDFSWTRAMQGAWAGLVGACLSFGLGAYATATAISWSTVASAAADLAQGALTNAALSVVVEYASGQRDIDALLETFGTTLVTSFVSGASGALGGVAGGVAGKSKYFTQMARGMVTTAMKRLNSPHEPVSITVSLWYVELTVSEDDPIALSIDGSAIVSEVEMVAGKTIESWARVNGPEWDWATRSIQAVRSVPDRVGLSHLGSVRDLAMMRHGSLYDVATTALLRNPYVAGQQRAITTWLDQSQLRRQVQDGLDTARAFPWRLVEDQILD